MALARRSQNCPETTRSGLEKDPSHPTVTLTCPTTGPLRPSCRLAGLALVASLKALSASLLFADELEAGLIRLAPLTLAGARFRLQPIRTAA